LGLIGPGRPVRVPVGGPKLTFRTAPFAPRVGPAGVVSVVRERCLRPVSGSRHKTANERVPSPRRPSRRARTHEGRHPWRAVWRPWCRPDLRERRPGRWRWRESNLAGGVWTCRLGALTCGSAAPGRVSVVRLASACWRRQRSRCV